MLSDIVPLSSLTTSLDRLINTPWRCHKSEDKCFFDFGGDDDVIPDNTPITDIILYFETKFPGCSITWCDNYFVEYDRVRKGCIGKGGIKVQYKNSIKKKRWWQLC